MYKPVPAQVDLPAMEREILALWDAESIFETSIEQSAGRPLWTFYEGPPTANGTPGTHHVEARVFKDIFPRHRTMKGYFVPRQAGWDCHGLPVELAVERELGFNGKQDIEQYGISAFNARCRESVLRHVDEFTDMSKRMGFWVDTEAAYWTMDARYIESVWWSLKTIFDSGLLVQDHRVSPYCPRCGTGLSDHELAQGYEAVEDPSVYVRFPVASGPLAERYPGIALLVWTTTPWTLVSNTAVAVRPDSSYAIVRTSQGEILLVAEDLVTAVFADNATVLESISGRQLEHVPYIRPFDLIDIPDSHFVILADYVTVDDGTGLVHQAPAFGADDLASCRAYGLPIVNPIGNDGSFIDSVPLVGGTFFKDADDRLISNLQERSLLFRHDTYQHSYPHCWRCHTALLYYAQPSWYIKTTNVKDELLAQNEGTRWFPETIKWGRYGDWLTNNVDWALSRNRYWGTPLPIWRCHEGHLTAVGSLRELSELAGRDVTDLDPHRPFVDEVIILCPHCGAESARVPEVIDCWYDSGAMPFAAKGYPHNAVDTFTNQYPADFICEAIDQTRGWFYSLMAVGTLVFGESAYRNVVCLGHILDEEGRKMSKHLGNVLEPIPLMDEHGADAVRWFMLASGSPWQARRVGHAAIADVVRKTLLTYWNTVAFQSLYARTAHWTPADSDTPIDSRPLIDQWALSEANRMAQDVDAALLEFDTQRGGRILATFIDDLSNWYVRRSRRRFWDGEPAALATLHEVLRITTLCLAPFTPFITERVWQDLFRPTSPSACASVHLERWPGEGSVDDELRDHMSLVRTIVELGRAARSSGNVKTRQPLARALVSAAGWTQLPPQLIQEVCSELNVLKIEPLSAEIELVSITVKANFRELGQRFSAQTPDVAAAIAAQDASELVRRLRERNEIEIVNAGETFMISAADIVITESPQEGWAVASDGAESVALDLEIDDALRSAGLAREVVRIIQEARKSSGFEITDRIVVLWMSGNPDMKHALREHEAEIAEEVLAIQIRESSDELEATITSELPITLAIQRTVNPKD